VNEDDLNSLEILLKKAKAINTINAESLVFIQSRRGEQVIIDRKYYFDAKEKNQLQKDNDENEEEKTGFKNDIKAELDMSVHNTSKEVSIIVNSWRYEGEPLKKEIVGFDYFIDTSLSEFDDLFRLQKDYQVAISNYSDILSDKPKSRIAAKILLDNVEILQVAIGQIHEQVIDMKDVNGVDDDALSTLKMVSEGIEQLKLKGVFVRLEAETREVPEKFVDKDDDEPHFLDLNNISCKATLDKHCQTVWDLETYLLKGTQYLASASSDKTIEIWNMNENKNVATLTGHEYRVASLKSFQAKDLTFLASGSDVINIWDLSSNSLVETLTGHSSTVYSLETFEKDGIINLISGSFDKTIKIWDITNYTLLDTLECNIGSIYSLKTFYRDCKPYLSVGSSNGLAIWCLTHNLEVAILNQGNCAYHSVEITNFRDSMTLACGKCSGEIELWNLENHHLIGLFNVHQKIIRSLEWVRCNDKVCLVSSSDDLSIKVWDLENNEVSSKQEMKTCMNAISVMMKEGCPYLISGDDDGKVKLWAE